MFVTNFLRNLFGGNMLNLKSTLKLVAMMFVLSSPMIAQSAEYSETCNDYAALKFSSKAACLKDGRWHLVYENSSSGSVVSGSISDLNSHVIAGAEFKVVIPNFMSRSLTEKCQQVYRSQSNSNIFYCLSPMRFTGETTGISHGSARYGSDGSLYCNGVSGGGNGCGSLTLGAKWYIRY